MIVDKLLSHAATGSMSVVDAAVGVRLAKEVDSPGRVTKRQDVVDNFCSHVFAVPFWNEELRTDLAKSISTNM